MSATSYKNSLLCPNCRLPVSPQALMCPHCGIAFSEFKRDKRNKKLMIWGGGAAVIFIAAFLLFYNHPEFGPKSKPVKNVIAGEIKKDTVPAARKPVKPVSKLPGIVNTKKEKPEERKSTIPENKRKKGIEKNRSGKITSTYTQTSFTESTYCPDDFTEMLSAIVRNLCLQNDVNPKIIRDLELEVYGNRVKASGNLTLDYLDEDILHPQDRPLFRKMKNVLPFLFKNDIGVEFSGRHYVTNSVLHIDPRSKIKIGFLSFSLRKIKELIGVDKDIWAAFRLDPVDDVQIIDIHPKNDDIIVKSKKIASSGSYRN